MRTLFLTTALVVCSGHAYADPLLIPKYEHQLEEWLGIGDLIFQNLFTKTEGADAAAWHASVDGQGPTFTLLEAVDGTGETHILGGFNPQSWFNSDQFAMTTADDQRNAFIYNLTLELVRRQRLTSDGCCGEYQTYNGPSGFQFGGGSDLFVDHRFASGFEGAYSYGAGTAGLIPLGPHGDHFAVGAFETYSFSVAPEPVPEPSLLVPLAGGLLMFINRKRRRRLDSRSQYPAP